MVLRFIVVNVMTNMIKRERERETDRQKDRQKEGINEQAGDWNRSHILNMANQAFLNNVLSPIK